MLFMNVPDYIVSTAGQLCLSRALLGKACCECCRYRVCIVQHAQHLKTQKLARSFAYAAYRTWLSLHCLIVLQLKLLERSSMQAARSAQHQQQQHVEEQDEEMPGMPFGIDQLQVIIVKVHLFLIVSASRKFFRMCAGARHSCCWHKKTQRSRLELL